MSRADEYLEFPDRDDVARLEAEFWQCERTAASIGMGFDEGLLCAELTERLKRERFNGSFDDMLLWWNAGKAASLGAPAGSSSGESDTSEMVP
jgi:hypothetical protein